MQTILVAIDFSGTTDAILQAVDTLARVAPSRPQVVVVHVHQRSVPIVDYASVLDQAAFAEEKNAAEQLEHVRQSLESDGYVAKSRLLFGGAAAGIIDEAKKVGADYLIIGSNGHGRLRHLLLGSTTMAVLHEAPCPVLVIPAQGSKPADAETASDGNEKGAVPSRAD